MPKLCRNGDLGTTGHLCDSVIDVVTTQSNVRANGIPVARLNDPTNFHTIPVPCPPPPGAVCCVSHMSMVKSCSATVRVNSIGVARDGDSFDFGAMFQGSHNVRAG
jgi:uncharacterized Zn-binding protein involved in type VI secretion|tara:strand:+ start:42 stop:359 length:318 start_codon:yes stop_codon:yes gene_type:complete